MDWQSNLLLHAQTAYPQECCGLLIQVGGERLYMACRNSATQPEQDFVIHPEDLAMFESMGEIVGICHSHPNASSKPSERDIYNANALKAEYPNADWHIASWPEGDIHSFTPSGEAYPLIGRPFIYGVMDCYAIVRDFYEKLNIALPKNESEDLWWEGDQELYLDNFESAGFYKLCSGAPDEIANTQLEVGDVILMQILSDRVNHAALYIGDGIILQHLYGKLSQRDVFGGYWLRCTRLVIRHNQLIDLDMAKSIAKELKR
ncbi:C40 family peptidase [Vibrio cholerae]|uniref:C40 family peptidase n=1 Tax=Vibrio cholerae TaxID=666 RepID=UPI00155E8C35|nr:C40 family peptidase [Vibrio cholerae]NOE09470.1 peptidase P60 [Vibrio cholerae]